MKEYVGNRFWKHIHKETLYPFDEIPTRTKYLDRICESVLKMSYSPLPPRAFVVSHKQNLVVRFVPTLSREDYCVYFFCIKCLEDEIAKNRVLGTYGGWKLGGKIRKLEIFDEAASIPDNTFNKFAWKQAWTDYQKKAYRLYKKGDFQFFVVFDIANFYDSVRLNRLETKIREVVGKNKTTVVNLLFHFLYNWDKKDLNYERQNIGLPQDEVGDSSRILANFYLQDYDSHVYNISSKKNSAYLRYADDQIIGSPDEKTVKELMFRASKELAKIGLNLNASKAKFLTREEFFIYWSFDILKLLENKNDIAKIKDGYELFKERLKDKENFRQDTILKRLLNCNIRKLAKSYFRDIIKMSKERTFIASVNNYYLKRIYSFLDKNQKEEFIRYLNRMSDDVLFNEFHLRVLRFARENGIDLKKFTRLRRNLNLINEIR